MVLRRAALALPAGMSVKHPAEFLTNGQAAAGSLDPRVTRASLTRAGRLSGYALGYSIPRSKFEHDLIFGSGQLNVLTEVDLYRSVAGPAAVMHKGIQDLRALVGKPVRGGARLVQSAVFRVRSIGDAAVGARIKIGIKGFQVYYTEVAFRYGRLLADVVEARADATNVDPAVISLARLLDERIKGVASGNVQASGGS